MQSDNEIVSARELDKFYTSDDVAKMCVNILEECLPQAMRTHTVVEPSAGGGAFLRALKRCDIAMDVAPEAPGIVERDYLTSPRNDAKGRVLTVGNPPFGKNSSLALKFFNRAAVDSDIIAFILPKTFRKASLINRCDENFHIVVDVDLPPNSFVFDGAEYNVPCTFQIWSRQIVKREKIHTSVSHDDFKFVDKNNADVALQRVGANAGRIHRDFKDRSPSSTYFLKFMRSSARKFFDTYDFTKLTRNTAGCPSLAKSEIISAYVGAMK